MLDYQTPPPAEPDDPGRYVVRGVAIGWAIVAVACWAWAWFQRAAQH